MRAFSSVVTSALVSVFLLAAPAMGDEPFPHVINLPSGFRPEGIAHGHGNTLYVDNFDHGAIYKVDARTGAGHLLVAASETRMGVGIKFDHRTNYLFTAGGATGHAFVWDAETGALVSDIALAPGSDPTFINDLFITPEAVYFTDSFRPDMYEVPLARDGALRAAAVARVIPLTGDYEFIPETDPANPVFNGNGIERTPDRRALLIMNSKTGKLYTLDPSSGHTDQIDLGGVVLPTCDGFLLLGRTLYVAQNTNNIAVVALSRDGHRGRVTSNITDPSFNTIATEALLDDAIYVTNPEFQQANPDGHIFTVVRVPVEN